MFRGGLFWRTFSAIMAAVLIAIAIFSGVLLSQLRTERENAYEKEVRLQAEEVASFISDLDQLSSVRVNTTMQRIILNKISDIHTRYTADIWIVAYKGDISVVRPLDSNWGTSESIYEEAVVNQLLYIQQGNEIQVTGLFPELGDQIVTIGVPCKNSDGDTFGAVLLHIPSDALSIHLSDLLPQILPAAAAALLLGTCLAILLARSQTKPLREIDQAVRDFTGGDFSRRISLKCGGELGVLGSSINRMAQELSELEESRKSFVAAVSHELRSPLTSIRGYVDAMLDGTISEEDRPKYLAVVRDEADRLTSLVKDLLDMSRLESGRFPLTITPFDANETLRRSLITFENRIEEKGIHVDVAFEQEHQYVMGDMDRIHQVFNNLIDNALKFLPSGGTLRITSYVKNKNCHFAIGNNGPRISEEDLPHIFDRFYKADKAHTSGNGTGLGLAICRMIMQEHHQQITVRSDDAWTEFSLSLPVSSSSE